MKTGAGGDGEILRSACRRDRHSKVFTAKGPRDRRVRLSAHTAIRFYDVQDRLGYDRPSKAVDWLINKAKFAIDNLNSKSEYDNYGSQIQMQSASGTFAPPLESFFPTTTSINFQGYPPENLGLSLHNFHDSRPSPEDSIPAGYEPEDAGLWLQQPVLGQRSAAVAISQRGPLQSSLGHDWSNQRTQNDSSLPGGRFYGSSEFRAPPRIGGEGGENGVVSGSHSSSPNCRR